MDFKQIEAFVNVVKYKSFSKAADALFLTQPTISAHIITLEKELGIQLIDRKSREALVTRQGKIFYNYALDMMNMREKAIFSLQKNDNNVEGILEIQTSSIPGEYLVPELLAIFRKKYQKVKFYLEQSDSHQVIENLLSNKGEIGFVGSVKSGKDNNFEFLKLISDQMVLIAPRSKKNITKIENSNKQAGNQDGCSQIEKVNISVFLDMDFILREQGSATRKDFEDKLSNIGILPSRLKVIARMNSLEAIKRSVAAGMGVSIISKKAAIGSNLNYDIFELEDIDLTREFYMAYNSRVELSPVAEVFKEFVMKQSKLMDNK